MFLCSEALIELASDMGHLTLTDLACAGFYWMTIDRL